MKCPRCGSDKTEIIIIPSIERLEISKFEKPDSKPAEPSEKIKCIRCGFYIKD
jgi:hypothetical protein